MKFFGTFGVNDRLAKKYVVIEGAADIEQARETMFDHFNQKWADVYDEPKFTPMIDDYGLEQWGEPINAVPTERNQTNGR